MVALEGRDISTFQEFKMRIVQKRFDMPCHLISRVLRIVFAYTCVLANQCDQEERQQRQLFTRQGMILDARSHNVGQNHPF